MKSDEWNMQKRGGSNLWLKYQHGRQFNTLEEENQDKGLCMKDLYMVPVRSDAILRSEDL